MGQFVAKFSSVFELFAVIYLLEGFVIYFTEGNVIVGAKLKEDILDLEALQNFAVRVHPPVPAFIVDVRKQGILKMGLQDPLYIFLVLGRYPHGAVAVIYPGYVWNFERKVFGPFHTHMFHVARHGFKERFYNGANNIPAAGINGVAEFTSEVFLQVWLKLYG